MTTDILGTALLDYQKGNYTEDIKTTLNFNTHLEEEHDVLPLPYLFRNYTQMPKLEKEALQLCKGNILDIGCGAGSHSLYLQNKGMNVTALDNSAGAIKTCKLRGINHCVHTKITDYKEARFDTLLLLMNGIGLAGALKNLPHFFEHLRLLLNTNGQILLDSSDIIYMFDKDDDGGVWLPMQDSYYGEVSFIMEYKNNLSKPFNWLYLDYNLLEKLTNAYNFKCERIHQGKHYDYLARITSK